MAFHLGKPILVMIAIACAAGVASSLTRRGDDRADLELWCFSEQNWKTLTGAGLPSGVLSLREQYEEESGKSTSIKLIQFRSLNTRVAGMFRSGIRWPELPDAVDLEISAVGRYFRPPVDEVGLLPLNELLERHGWSDELVKNRVATWSKGGTVFGIPLDVHPTMIVYNEELFREAGVDLASSQTWDEFIENCLAFQAYWRKKSPNLRRWAFEMSDSAASTMVMLLLQRGVNLVDQQEALHLTDDVVLDTLVKYCRMMTGPRQIAASTADGDAAFALDLGSGYVCSMLCPDWRLRYLKDKAPTHLAGKMRAMPLPAWPDSTYRTTTWGGSMSGIPRNVRDPEASFKLLEKMYLSPEGIDARSGSTYIIPPVKSAWDNPAYDKPDPYYSNQPIKRLYAKQAENVPPRFVSPASVLAETELANVLIAALAEARSTADDSQLRERCRWLLAEADTRVRRQIEHGSYEK